METRLLSRIDIQQGGTVYTLTLLELAALYRILEKQWINHEDQEAIDVVDRIGKILREAK